MDQVSLTIDGKTVSAEKGATVLQAALKNDIYIPHLCFHPELKPSGVCRLCTVEINGKPVFSCQTPVQEGLDVKTRTPEIDQARRVNIEILVANHHTSCKGCAGIGHCVLPKLMGQVRLDRKRVKRLRLPQEERPIDTANPCFDYDPNKCVLCGICVQTCEPIQKALHIVGRGPKTKIAFYGDTAVCETCGKCVARCPVGSLIPKGKTALKESA